MLPFRLLSKTKCIQTKLYFWSCRHVTALEHPRPEIQQFWISLLNKWGKRHVRDNTRYDYVAISNFEYHLNQALVPSTRSELTVFCTMTVKRIKLCDTRTKCATQHTRRDKSVKWRGEHLSIFKVHFKFKNSLLNLIAVQHLFIKTCLILPTFARLFPWRSTNCHATLLTLRNMVE